MPIYVLLLRVILGSASFLPGGSGWLSQTCLLLAPLALTGSSSSSSRPSICLLALKQYFPEVTQHLNRSYTRRTTIRPCRPWNQVHPTTYSSALTEACSTIQVTIRRNSYQLPQLPLFSTCLKKLSQVSQCSQGKVTPSGSGGDPTAAHGYHRIIPRREIPVHYI